MSEKSFRLGGNNNESKEKKLNNFEVLDSSKLRKIFLHEDREIIDSRFNSQKEDWEDGKSGVFKYFRPEDTCFQLSGSEIVWPIIKNKDGKIVGISKIVKHNNDIENKRHMYFLSIDPEFQGQRYASKLTENLFKYLKENNLILEMSSYTNKHSWERLKPLFERYSKEYGVELLENDKKMGWR